MPRLRSILLWRLHPASYQGHLTASYDLFGQVVGTARAILETKVRASEYCNVHVSPRRCTRMN